MLESDGIKCLKSETAKQEPLGEAGAVRLSSTLARRIVNELEEKEAEIAWLRARLKQFTT